MNRLYIVCIFIYLFYLPVTAQQNNIYKSTQLLFKQQKNKDALNKLQSILQSQNSKLSTTNLDANDVCGSFILAVKFYKNNQQYDSSIQLAKQIIQHPLFTVAADSLKAQLQMELGLSYSLNSQFIESIETYNEILAKYERVLKNDIPFWSLLHIEISWSHSNLGNQKNEIEGVSKAIAIMEANFSKIKEYDFIAAYNNLFYYYGEYDDLNEQLSTFKKYSSYYLPLYKNGGTTSNYYYAKRVYRKMQIICTTIEDQPEKAYSFLKQVKQEIAQSPQSEKQEDIRYYLSCLSSVCDYYNFYSKDNIAGIKMGNEFLQEAVNQKDSFNIMLANSKLANQYREMNDFDKALYHVNASLNSFHFPPTSLSKFGLETMKALNLSSNAKHADAIAIMENNILSIIQGHTNKKIGILQINPTELKELNNSRYINIFATSSLVFLEAYKQKKETIYLTKAEKLVETAAIMFGEFYRKGSYNSTLSNLQNKIIEAYLFIATEKYAGNFQQQKNILQVIEANASFHLAKEFEQKLLRSNAGIGSLLNQQSLLLQQKEFWANQQLEKGSKENFSAKIKAVESQLQNIQQQIDAAKKGFTNLSLSNFSVDACMKLLSSNEAIVKYYVANKNVYSVIFTNKNIEVKLLCATKDLESTTKQYLVTLKQLQPNYQQLSHKLYSTLTTGIKAENITIIPDNYLNYLPFESLQNPSSKSFLIHQTNIAYNYSLSLWYLHSVNKSSNKSMDLAAFAPNYSNAYYNSSALMNLPFAQQEANAIAQLFKGKEFLGDVATKSNFLSNNQQFNMLHCSMHSILYDNDFNKSCLLFNNVQPLYFSELYATAIPAEMIVLSACNTGAGKLMAGEGMMSLSRAFTYAGVKSTVVSLWQVPDKETSDLMVLFYQQLKKGLSKAEALAQAKKEFIKANPLKSHPYYWSGFILTGNDDAVVKNNNWIYYLGAIVAAALLVFFLWEKKEKNY